MAKFKVGDNVVKNPQRWISTEFDGWGAGQGVGRVSRVYPDLVDVVWPSGRAGQIESELMPAPASARFARSMSTIKRDYR